MAEETKVDDGITVPIVASASPDHVIYADILGHVSAINGVVRLLFTQSLVDVVAPGSGWKSHPSAVIVMPMTQFRNMIDTLQLTLRDFEDRGWITNDAE